MYKQMFLKFLTFFALVTCLEVRAKVIECADSENNASVRINLGQKTQSPNRVVLVEVKIHSENYERSFSDIYPERFFQYSYFTFYDENFFDMSGREIRLIGGLYRVNYNADTNLVDLVFKKDAISETIFFKNLICDNAK